MSLIKDDFERDSAVSDFKYYEKAHFHINYDRSGNLIKAKTMTFFRRNEYILGISFNKNTGQISMLGKSLASDVKARLRASGLDTSGELRIFSDGIVVSHNATTVRPFEKRGPGYKMYTWKIANLLSPTPAFKIQVHSPRQQIVGLVFLKNIRRHPRERGDDDCVGGPLTQQDEGCFNYSRVRRRMRLDVSQRFPPIAITSA